MGTPGWGLRLAALVLIAGTVPAGAQWLDRPWPGIPRTADGKPNLTAPAPRGPDGKPDLTGIWDGALVVARPEPGNLQPWVMDRARQHQLEYYKMRPYYQCRPSGPEAERFAGWKRILQTPTVIAILNDDLTYRVIHIDGRQLETDPAPSWTGYSVGRWEGDTLVVETTNFHPSQSFRGASEHLKVTERFTRTGPDTILYKFTIDDPGTFARPWTGEVPFTRIDELIYEYACHEGNYGMTGILVGARMEERAKAAAPKHKVRRRALPYRTRATARQAIFVATKSKESRRLPVTQEIALSVKSDKVECAINNKVVASYNKADLVTAGKLKSTDGIYGVRFAHNTEVLVSGLKMTKN